MYIAQGGRRKSGEEEWNDARRIRTRLTVGLGLISSRGGAGHYGRRMGAAPLLSVHPRQRPPPPPFPHIHDSGLINHLLPPSPMEPYITAATSQDPGIICSPLAPPPFFHPVTDRNPFIRRTDAAFLGKLAAVK